jgi:hypothetical protein
VGGLGLGQIEVSSYLVADGKFVRVERLSWLGSWLMSARSPTGSAEALFDSISLARSCMLTAVVAGGPAVIGARQEARERPSG